MDLAPSEEKIYPSSIHCVLCARLDSCVAHAIESFHTVSIPLSQFSSVHRRDKSVRLWEENKLWQAFRARL